MFQFFAGALLAQSFEKSLEVDISRLPFGFTHREFELGKIDISIPYSISDKKFFWINFKFIEKIYRIASRSIFSKFLTHYVSSVIGFDEILEKKPKLHSITGYFQSWKYLLKLTETESVTIKLREQYASPEFKYLYSLLLDQKVVGIHIRRGDYKFHENTFGKLSPKYFSDARDFLQNSGFSGDFWVFTD